MAHSAPPQPLSWTVVGQGAIGLLAACRLRQQQTAVSLWLREKCALNVQFIEAQQSSAYVFSSPPEMLSAVLVPVKSYAVAEAIKQLKPCLTADAQLVISHNGMPDLASLQSLLTPEQGLWFLTTTHGAVTSSSNNLITIEHTGNGNSILAPINTAASQHTETITAAMNRALGPLQQVDDIRPFLWQKLAINAAINPLTAIHNCRNGALSQPQYQAQISAIIAEVCMVAAASGYPLDASKTSVTVEAVIEKTALNYSSMQQDIVRQRQTEIDAITGFIVRQANKFGLDVPQNRQLQQQILQLQQKPV